jgi:hypothetical protein
VRRLLVPFHAGGSSQACAEAGFYCAGVGNSPPLWGEPLTQINSVGLSPLQSSTLAPLIRPHGAGGARGPAFPCRWALPM